MPVGELVMHIGVSYYKNPPTLGVVTEIYVEGGRYRYTVEWLNSRFPGDMSTEDSSTIQPLRKAYRRWKEKNVAVQTKEEGT